MTESLPTLSRAIPARSNEVANHPWPSRPQRQKCGEDLADISTTRRDMHLDDRELADTQDLVR